MEELNSVWQIGIIALLLGAMIGILAYRLLSPSVRQNDQIKSDLESARDELENYRASVNQHFDKTSELVNDLTQNYVKVYQHLAEGAQTLGDGKTFSNRLEHHPGRVSIALEDPREAPRDIEVDAIVDAAPAPTGSLDEHAAPYRDSAIAGETSNDAEAFAAGDGPGAGDAPAGSKKPDSGDASATSDKPGADGMQAASEQTVEAEAEGDAPPRPGVDSGGESGAREPVLNVEALDEARDVPESPLPGGTTEAKKTAEAAPDPGPTRH